MGINLHVALLGQSANDAAQHPAWDWLRAKGDRAFWNYLINGAEDDDDLREGEGEYLFQRGTDGEAYHRPTDFPACRAWVARQYADDVATHQRLTTLLDILEWEPDYWLYASM